jgi:hypothetical protein
MHAVRQNCLFFYSGRLLSSLLCHWLVDIADGRGFLKVIPLTEGPFSLFVEVDREGENGLLWWLICC